jgi:hypothetical protein
LVMLASYKNGCAPNPTARGLVDLHHALQEESAGGFGRGVWVRTQHPPSGIALADGNILYRLSKERAGKPIKRRGGAIHGLPKQVG